VPEEIQIVTYTGDEDLSLWLEEQNGDDDPHIFPLWPDAYPERLAVFINEDATELGVATSRDAMIAARKPERLWFCNIPRDTFIANTDVEFGDTDAPSTGSDGT
jgi:hypothetical protein